MTMKFIIESGESRKKITCSSAMELEGLIQTKFHLDNGQKYFLQEYDKEENLFFDVDDISEVENGARFLSTTNEIGCDNDDEMDVRISQNPSSSSTELVGSRPAASIVEESSKPLWPSKFLIPSKHFGETLMQYLANKQQLNKTLRTQLFTVIYEEASRYKYGRHPESAQYCQIAETLLNAYLYLRGKAHFSDSTIVSEFSRLTEINLMEQFVNGVREFAASIVNLKPFKNELRILKEIRGKMVTAKLQSRKEYYQQCCALLVVLQQLREDSSKMFLYNEHTHSSYPRILIDCEQNPFEDDVQFSLLVGVQVCT